MRLGNRTRAPNSIKQRLFCFLSYLYPAENFLEGLEAVQFLRYLHHAGSHSAVQLREQVLGGEEGGG